LVDEACADGYAVYDDLIIGITPATGDFAGYAWDISPEVEAILVAAGQTDALNELNAQVLSVCGDIMMVYNTEIGVGGPSTFDGSGWVWPQFNGYMAPVSGFDAGCGDPNACNFDPCSIPDDASCTDLEVVAEVVGDWLTVQVSGGSPPFTFNVLSGELDPIGFPPATQEEPSLVLVGLPDGVYCIEASDSFGCTAMACDTLGIVSVEDAQPLSFQMHPNPTSGSVQLTLPANWDVQSIVLRDATGRALGYPELPISDELQVGRLTPGTYLVEVRHADGVAIERLVVRH
jgi:hypothetical protein